MHAAVIVALLLGATPPAVPEPGAAAEATRVAYKKRVVTHSEEGKRIEAFWGKVFAAPTAHSWELGLGAGRLFRQSAALDRNGGWLLRLSARRQLSGWVPGGDWLGAGAFVQTGWWSEGSRQLEYTSTDTMLGVNAGLLRWLGRFRADASLEGGAILQTDRIDDGSDATRQALVVAPGLGASAGLGVAIAGRALAGAHFTVRYYPRRWDMLFLVDVEWLLGARPVEPVPAPPAVALDGASGDSAAAVGPAPETTVEPVMEAETGAPSPQTSATTP
jgi:hypothetical protein